MDNARRIAARCSDAQPSWISKQDLYACAYHRRRRVPATYPPAFEAMVCAIRCVNFVLWQLKNEIVWSQNAIFFGYKKSPEGLDLYGKKRFSDVASPPRFSVNGARGRTRTGTPFGGGF